MKKSWLKRALNYVFLSGKSKSFYVEHQESISKGNQKTLVKACILSMLVASIVVIITGVLHAVGGFF